MKLTTTKDRAVQYVRAIVHGDSGIGKTTSLRTLPADKTLIAAAERGLVPLRKSDYPVAIIESWDDVRELVRSCQFEPCLPHLDGRVIRILAIDSLTEFSTLCMKQIIEVDRPKLIGERTGDKRKVPEKVYEDLMQMEDFNLYRNRMHAMLAALCHLPVHVVCTALTAWHEDKQTGSRLRTPAFPGKLATEAGAHFDLILHMISTKDAEGKDARAWQTFNDGLVIAKDSSGALDPYEATDWTQVFGKILGNGNSNDSPPKKQKGGAK